MLKPFLKLNKVVVCLLAAATLLLVTAPAYTYAVSLEGSEAGSPATEGPDTNTDICKGEDQCSSFIRDYINPIILLLSALVGIIAIISIIRAGIMYSASADDPGLISKSKQLFFNTVIGLVAYIFLFAFLNYLVPGGIL